MRVYFSSPLSLLTQSADVEEKKTEVKEKPYYPKSKVENQYEYIKFEIQFPSVSNEKA